MVAEVEPMIGWLITLLVLIAVGGVIRAVWRAVPARGLKAGDAVWVGYGLTYYPGFVGEPMHGLQRPVATYLWLGENRQSALTLFGQGGISNEAWKHRTVTAGVAADQPIDVRKRR